MSTRQEPGGIELATASPTRDSSGTRHTTIQVHAMGADEESKGAAKQLSERDAYTQVRNHASCVLGLGRPRRRGWQRHAGASCRTHARARSHWRASTLQPTAGFRAQQPVLMH